MLMCEWELPHLVVCVVQQEKQLLLARRRWLEPFDKHHPTASKRKRARRHLGVVGKRERLPAVWTNT